jgi:hypothetical protein
MYVWTTGEEMEPTELIRETGAKSEFSDGDVFELVYQGPDVTDGTMNARELLEVLSGLTKAFSSVAQERDLEGKYELRIRDIESNSVHLIFEAVVFAKANPGAAAALAAGGAVIVSAVTNSVSGAYRIVTDLAKLIDAKKRSKGARIATLPAEFSDGGVVLSASGELIILTKEQYELLLSQRVDRQLAQIVSPLEQDRIDSFQIVRSNEELVSVEARQKDFFDYVEVTEERSREGTEILGTLNSLTKSNLRGTFYTTEGVHVPYRYTGGDIGQLLRGFSAREPLRVSGRVSYGNDGIPSFIEVQEIEFLQQNFLNSA